MEFNFIEVPFKESPLVELRRMRVIRAPTVEFINLAFKHGAYVGGGFAALLARYQIAGLSGELGDAAPGTWFSR